ncbi:MAG: hypothetical protein LKF32_07635 [Mageeibacillus sp.]|jgi:diacylglycerol kinase family enzyme|nr:hypothetical protein [Mageeibacillus sp.]MCI1263864.1 hypothetical protein [Saccharofermentans sp.]
MRKLFIVNSKSDSERLEDFRRSVEGFAPDHKADCEFFYTEYAGHAGELVRELAASDDKDMIIVACGGDGTVHEVANVLAGTGTAMAVVPMGTGNDFARSIMDENHRRSCDYCLSELIKDDFSIKPIDLIKVESFDSDGNLIPGSSAWCNNVASIGLDTAVQLRAKSMVNRHPKSAIVRKTAYAFAAVTSLFGSRSFDFCYKAVRGDGKDPVSGERRYTLISVCNGSYCGNGFCPAPQARVNDGLLSVCSVSDVKLARAVYLIIKYSKGKHIGLKDIDSFEVTSVDVTATSEKRLNGNYDGEDFSGVSVRFTCVPGALNLVYYG